MVLVMEIAKLVSCVRLFTYFTLLNALKV